MRVARLEQDVFPNCAFAASDLDTSPGSSLVRLKTGKECTAGGETVRVQVWIYEVRPRAVI